MQKRLIIYLIYTVWMKKVCKWCHILVESQEMKCNQCFLKVTYANQLWASKPGVTFPCQKHTSFIHMLSNPALLHHHHLEMSSFFPSVHLQMLKEAFKEATLSCFSKCGLWVLIRKPSSVCVCNLGSIFQCLMWAGGFKSSWIMDRPKWMEDCG